MSEKRKNEEGSLAALIDRIEWQNWYWLFWVFILLLYFIIRTNIIDIPLDRDEGVFGYTGQVILDGGLPYRDVFDHKPPVVFYTYALGLLIFPPTATGIHLFLHTYNLLTLVSLYFVAKIICDSRAAGLSVALVFAVLSSLPSLQGFTASTEMFLILPISLSLLFTFLSIRDGKWYHPFLAGIFAALAFWTKATAAFLIAFIGLYLLVRLYLQWRENNQLREAIMPLVWWAAGFMLPSALIPLYFLVTGTFDEFVYWSFTHNYLYSERYRGLNLLPTLWAIFWEIVVSNLVVVLIGLGGVIYAFVRRDWRGLFLTGFVIFSVVSTGFGFVYRHYFAQILPAIALFIGIGFFILFDRIKRPEFKIGLVIVFVLALVLVPVASHSDYYLTDTSAEISREYFSINPFPESEAIAEFLKNDAEEGDTIFVYGSEPQILVYSELKSATPFAMIYPLTFGVPRNQEFQQMTREAVNEENPKYILTFTIPYTYLYDGVADLWIGRYTEELITEDYSLVAVSTVEEPEGNFYLVSEIEDIVAFLQNHRYTVRVFKRNDNGDVSDSQ